MWKRNKEKEKRILEKGEQFNNLVVIDNNSVIINNEYHYLCKCLLCGKDKYIQKNNLINLKQKSCGCLNYRYGKAVNKRLNKIFNHMKDRCYNPKCSNYNNYGKKGITICDEWLSDRKTFFGWAFDNGYNDKLSIDRIDGTKGYSPNNCRWATAKQQARNLCTNRTIQIGSKTKFLCEWAEEYNLKPSTILKRINRGISGKKLLEPSKRKSEVMKNG